MRPGAYDPVDTGRFRVGKAAKFAETKAARLTFINDIEKREK